MGLIGVTKYRGTVDRRQRGEYKSAQLQATFGKEALARIQGMEVGPQSPFEEFDAYLWRAGAALHKHCKYDKPHRLQSGTYHYGGATVQVEYDEYEDNQWHDGTVTVTVVSNDPLEDVIERLCRKFPCLKKEESGRQEEAP